MSKNTTSFGITSGVHKWWNYKWSITSGGITGRVTEIQAESVPSDTTSSSHK
jgi:hypothetical protein